MLAGVGSANNSLSLLLAGSASLWWRQNGQARVGQWIPQRPVIKVQRLRCHMQLFLRSRVPGPVNLW